MTGPGEYEQLLASEQASTPPPGHFLSRELESDCARFLEEVRTLVRHREETAPGVGPGSRS
jgi:hypothetical protein